MGYKRLYKNLIDIIKEEQAKLRAEYLAAIRANIRGQLNQIDIINKDGSIENLGETHGDGKKHTS